MVLTIYGVSGWACAQRVIQILIEKQVPYRFIEVDYFGGATREPSFLENMQPFGQIPILEEDGFLLYESRAICRYIATKFADQGTPGLIPPANDLKAVAEFERACSLEYSQFNPPIEAFVNEVHYNKMRGLPVDEKHAEKHAEKLSSRLDGYEIILRKQRYLAGDHLTIADLFHLPYGEMITTLLETDFMTTSSRPHVLRWWTDISQRESWLAVKGP